MLVNHINYKDEQGRVYCRKLDEVIKLDDNHLENHCAGCKFFAGSAQGEGIECYWNDPRKNIDNTHEVLNPERERDEIYLTEKTTVKKGLYVK